MSYVSHNAFSQAKRIIQRGGSLTEAMDHLTVNQRQRGGAEAQSWLEYVLNFAEKHDNPLTNAQKAELGTIYEETLAVELQLDEIGAFRAAYDRDVAAGEFPPGREFAGAVEERFEWLPLANEKVRYAFMKQFVREGAILTRLGIAVPPEADDDVDME